jgi:tRNA pseudouridine55 synthase
MAQAPSAVAHGLLVVDKPVGPTSHRVAQRARKAFGTRGVGHAGTLDPAASGVLVLAVGEGRKLLRYLTLDDKRYETVIRLGEETDSLDAEGQVVATADVPALSAASVASVLGGFVGAQAQVPPVYSAIKQGGVSLHARARRGERVEPAPRDVIVHALELLALRDHALHVSIHCGKGFYVRSFARDLARALGSVGHVRALRRTQSGPYGLDRAVGYPLLEAAASGDETARGELARALIPVERALPDAPVLVLGAEGVAHARAGRPLSSAHLVEPSPALCASDLEPVLLLDEGGAAVALARLRGGELRVVRGFVR